MNWICFNLGCSRQMLKCKSREMQDAAQPGANTVFMGPKANVALFTLRRPSCSFFTPTLIAGFHQALLCCKSSVRKEIYLHEDSITQTSSTATDCDWCLLSLLWALLKSNLSSSQSSQGSFHHHYLHHDHLKVASSTCCRCFFLNSSIFVPCKLVGMFRLSTNTLVQNSCINIWLNGHEIISARFWYSWLKCGMNIYYPIGLAAVWFWWPFHQASLHNRVSRKIMVVFL